MSAVKAKARENPGDLAIRFIENLTLVGDYHGEKFILRPWQKDIVRPLFGTLLSDGRRQYRRAFIALPRKQAKTTLIAGMVGFMLLGECKGKGGQQIYSASGDQKQAALIFKTLAAMIRADRELDSLCLIYDSYKRIEFNRLGNTFEALSRESKLKHGLSPSAVFFDEVHVLPNRDLHDVLTTGFGARREPLTGYITTAGWDHLSLCYELWDYARKVKDGVLDDPTFLPVLHETPPEADWTSESVWHKAMPALGDFCSLEYIRDEFRRARESPAYENTFRQLYLNQWTEQATRWLSVERWQECKGDTDPATLAGQTCYGGLDLSATDDLTAFSLIFPSPDEDGSLDILCHFWAPEMGVWRKDPWSREHYPMWERQGYLTLTPGEVIDYAFIEQEVIEAQDRYDLRGLFVDKQFALMLSLRLRDVDGIRTEFVEQTFMRLNSPTRELERLVLSRQIRHGGNPILTWNVASAAIRTNPTALIMLSKKHSSGKIDGLAATINAIAGYAADGGLETSIYETRGLLRL